MVVEKRWPSSLTISVMRRPLTRSSQTWRRRSRSPLEHYKVSCSRSVSFILRLTSSTAWRAVVCSSRTSLALAWASSARRRILSFSCRNSFIYCNNSAVVGSVVSSKWECFEGPTMVEFGLIAMSYGSRA